MISKKELLSCLREDRSSVYSDKAKSAEKVANLSIRPSLSEQIQEIDLQNRSSLTVKFSCSASNYVDSYGDLITKQCLKDALKGSPSIPHIKDHIRSCTSHVGDISKIQVKEVPLSDLDLEKEGTCSILYVESEVKRDYDEKVFKFYGLGKIDQHSIGYNLKEFRLAVNGESHLKEEQEVWDSYIDTIINKEEVIERGYFWVLDSIELKEISSVLFGANPVTTTISVKSDPINKEGLPMTDQTKESELLSVKSQLEAMTVRATEAETKAAQATKVERDRVLSLIKSAKELDIPEDLLVKSIQKGRDPEDALDMFTTVAESMDKKSEIVPPETTPSIMTPIVPTTNEDFSKSLDDAIDRRQTETQTDLFKGVG